MSNNYSSSERIDSQKLNQAIAEIQKIAQERENTLTIEQAREVLRELNLPDELLAEALMQVKRQEALKEQARLNFMVTAWVLVMLVIGIGGTFWWQKRQAQNLNRVVAQTSSVVLASQPNQPVTKVSPPSEVVYQVTLTNAPIGQRLDMACDWQNPQGEVVRQNRYQTQEITKSVWATRCKHQIGMDTPRGTWQVTMYLGNRAIAKNSFAVQ
jgi:cytoskeletal protein RodZ